MFDEIASNRPVLANKQPNRQHFGRHIASHRLPLSIGYPPAWSIWQQHQRLGCSTALNGRPPMLVGVQDGHEWPICGLKGHILDLDVRMRI